MQRGKYMSSGLDEDGGTDVIDDFFFRKNADDTDVIDLFLWLNTVTIF